MGEKRIDDCRVPECLVDPARLGDDYTLRACPVRHRNVYNCSGGHDGDWRRIEPDPLVASTAQFSIGLRVSIIAGVFENFEAEILDINRDDQAALIAVYIFGRHTPFWISLRVLAPCP